MKKVFFILVIILLLQPLVFSFETDYSNNSSELREIKNILKPDTEIEWTEYVYVNNQWFQIIHYTDGTIGIVPAERYPED